MLNIIVLKSIRGVNMKCNCEYCMHFEYDDEYEDYVCTVDMDEDEVYRINNDRPCPYFRQGDEYTIARKQ